MPTRETFWNIPHWAEIGQYLLGLLAVIVFVIGIMQRTKYWRMGQPEKRTDQLGKRFISVLSQAIVQFRTVEDPFAGVMHLSIFWGMIVLVLGTALATIDWDVTRLFLDFQFLVGGVYFAYELILDILGVLLLVGLGLAGYRRYIVRPTSLHNDLNKKITWDDAYVLIMLLFVAISGYLVEGLRIAVTQPEWASWSPIGNVLASIFVGVEVASNRTFHLVLWIFHTLAAFIFIASVPFTKLFHLFAAPLNIFFRSFNSPGKLAPIRETNEAGVKAWQEFTWKQLLDFDACTRCGRCQDHCPIYLSGQAFSPRDMILKLSMLRNQKKGDFLHGGLISPQEIWACTTCFSCGQVCPVYTDLVSSIVDMRRYLVMDGNMDNELQDSLGHLGRYGNSFGRSPRARAKWSQQIQPKIKDARREEVEYLWFVGDYASYSPTLNQITQKTAKVFQHSGLDFGILYDAEQNSGNDVRRVGEEGLFEMLTEKNIKVLKNAKFKIIVTTDPHTYNTLKNEYQFSLNGGYEIVHYTELLDNLIGSGRLKFSKKLGYKVTYHDPCYLGRYNGIYDSPRRVIEATGCELVELPCHGDRAICCGAGGGRIWMQEGEFIERPSEMRIREAVKLDGVKFMIVACPKDNAMYLDAVKTTGYVDQLTIKDLIEIVAEAI